MTSQKRKEYRKLLEQAQKRFASHGILTAGHYISGVRERVHSPISNYRSGNTRNVDWDQTIQKASSKLTYSNDDTIVHSGSVIDRKENKIDHDFDLVKEGKSKVNGTTFKTEDVPGSIMVCDLVITTTKRDRDEDILEAEGARPDRKMPFLWQHFPWEIIGKMVKITEQNKKRVCGCFAIADTPLGRDAATLVEFGGLRISHGFKPIKFEPRSVQEKDAPGWHIYEFEIYEASLVSIPSNTDAIVTAWSREKLHHALVKDWAKSMNDIRPPMVVSGFSKPIIVNLGDLSKDQKVRLKSITIDPSNSRIKLVEDAMKLKSLSKKKTNQLIDAEDFIKDAMALPKMPKSASVLLKQAISNIMDVRKSSGRKEDEEDKEDEEEDKEDEEGCKEEEDEEDKEEDEEEEEKEEDEEEDKEDDEEDDSEIDEEEEKEEDEEEDKEDDEEKSKKSKKKLKLNLKTLSDAKGDDLVFATLLKLGRPEEKVDLALVSQLKSECESYLEKNNSLSLSGIG